MRTESLGGGVESSPPAASLRAVRLLRHFLLQAGKHHEFSLSSVTAPLIFWGPMIAFNFDSWPQ